MKSPPNPFHGRGSRRNLPTRFEQLAYEPIRENEGDIDEVAPETQVIPEQANLFPKAFFV